MKTRLGKIAQLPKPIRDQLNHRLDNGHQSPELLKWLNALPQTKKLLAKKFDHQPITKSNLSHWRHGGYQEWRMDQAREARIQRISESGASLEQAETGDLFENFARIAVAELMADLDSLQKLCREKRSQQLHAVIRDLARLQNSYNRSRWAALAWEKWNSGTGVPPVRSKLDLSAIASATAETRNSKPVTNSAPTSVAPDRTQSHGESPHDSKPPYNPIKIIHHTKCDCGEPCPKCHAPDSEYPLDEVLRDKKFYKEHSRHPYDRHGNPKHLMNCDCDCACDRCAEKIATQTTPTPRVDINGRVALPRDPIIRHADSRDEIPATNSTPQPLISPTSPNPLDPRSDFLRKMSLLKFVSP